ncbi:hypothetical protein [Streptococcus sp. zg-JUN1979]|uniref:hypothetical protein n=1 Tax=Streptococcus sp. zg-JUN1979 TaxID=3391450 RepID=UPI0039A4DDFE
MKAFWQFLKDKHSMYYVSLLYLIFPFYYSLTGVYDSYVLSLTVLFMASYLGLLSRPKGLLVNVLWVYLCVYVLVMTYTQSPQMSMFSFYLSNILTWHFQDDSKLSFRYVTFYALMIALLYPITVGVSIEVTIFLLVMWFVNIGMMYGMQVEIYQRRLETELSAKNESINLLLAENERNRIS